MCPFLTVACHGLLLGFTVLASSNTCLLAQETLPDIVQRAHTAHGGRWISGQIVDWVSEGKLTYFTVAGPQASFDVTVLRKGKLQIQRIIKQTGGEVRQGADGTRNWDSLRGWFVGSAHGHALDFIESQTGRSIQNLFNFQSEGLILQDLGTKNGARVIEAVNRSGRRTSYFIDLTTSLITRLEFVTGQSIDAFSRRPVPSLDTYIFSDFRAVNGVVTPFKIERYLDGIKAEEMRFTSVRYNAALKDDVFKP